MSKLEHQVQQEIVDAIGEIMDKYNLVMKRNRYLLYDGDDAQVSITEWILSASQYDIEIETICAQLLPQDYGKVEK